MFADLYAATDGRPSVPPQVLACATVLQALLHHSDPEAALALRCHLRWKARWRTRSGESFAVRRGVGRCWKS
jgi:hypothetical protein